MLLAVIVFTTSCRRSDAGKQTREPLAPMHVHTARAAVKPMDRVVVVTGSFHSREQSTLSVKVPGRLEKISVDIGSVVKKGDELARIEPADYELRLKQAEAVLGQARAVIGLPPQGDDDRVDIEKTGAIRQAKAVLEEATSNRNRVKQLHADKIAPQSELETVEAAYAVALSKYQDALEEIRGRVALVVQRRAELNLARKQLTDTVTTAPFDGIIHQRMANVGEYVQAGTPLIVIAGVNPLRLRLEVPEREATQVRAGQAVRVTVSGNTNLYTTTIARVSPILIEANRMLLVEADVPATPPLRPGLFAQAEILVSENDPALCVPADAVASFVGIEKAFVVKDGKALEKSITTGRRRGGVVEVLSGISAGDVVIMNPSRLRSGQPVVEELNAAAR
jgi:RND family efflux transporter MFP subunit